ncbi:MAG: PilZ domain-containing protein, partial [Myxococcota bacterium]
YRPVYDGLTGDPLEHQDDHNPALEDNRTAERIRIDAIVKVLSTGREFVFRTRDLSAKGLFLYTEVAMSYPFGVGSELTIELYAQEESTDFRAVVVRLVEPNTDEAKRYPTGFGLRITDIDDTNRARLRAMVHGARSA